ncbi:glutathione S-transferase family protein [Curvibacter sp. APW13]|uniref:glutathione S-transferase family protein n=1 Tax=Curvibacter sp. APW13 TaxID=3077236 RepID=UPI0028DDB3DF|nr:glutathione S-transferase family protein [Curvibacter sp. APW13]MDT8991798.1 glutathione S-transferase family protein [Curvibacter sp. APW13]
MITLHQFDPVYGLPNASPFCMKVETWLRMAGLPYEAPPLRMQVLGKAPAGKLPYIVDDGAVVADSTFIIDHLKAKHHIALDDWLSPSQQAQALAFQRLLEENLYWAVLYSRWIEPAGWALTRVAFFCKMPRPLRWFVPPLARRSMRQELHGHGMGRHTAAEITAIGQRDITAVADFLGDKPYFMGDTPCSLDASVYAFMANILWAPLDHPLQRHARQYPQLLAYCERMKSRYWG